MARSAKSRPSQGGGLWDTLRTVFWALLIAGAFRTILFQPFSIPSGSMKPELLIGDYLFVSKFSYGYSRYSLPFSPDWPWLFGGGRILGGEPERGDVVVFKHPLYDACSQGPLAQIADFGLGLVGMAGRRGPQDCVDYVKRIVGLPGDTVQMVTGILHINGEPVPTERIEDFIEPRIALGSPPRYPRCTNGPVSPGGDCAKEQFVERLPGGRAHRILNIDGIVGQAPAIARADPDNTPVFTVPEGHYFFMGDNRDNSVDSRFVNEVGMVPYENLIGRADLIAVSSEGAFWQIWNWRLGRLFKAIE